VGKYEKTQPVNLQDIHIILDCGCSSYPRKTNQTATLSFFVIIAYDILIFFENFHEYMSIIFGELELNVKISPSTLVWCCVDPKYLFAHRIETSRLEPVMVNIKSSGGKVLTEVSTILLNQCANNIIIKLEANIYIKRFIKIHSWCRALINALLSSEWMAGVIFPNTVIYSTFKERKEGTVIKDFLKYSCDEKI
jgi:hypothetical protein